MPTHRSMMQSDKVTKATTKTPNAQTNTVCIRCPPPPTNLRCVPQIRAITLSYARGPLALFNDNVFHTLTRKRIHTYNNLIKPYVSSAVIAYSVTNIMDSWSWRPLHDQTCAAEGKYILVGYTYQDLIDELIAYYGSRGYDASNKMQQFMYCKLLYIILLNESRDNLFNAKDNMQYVAKLKSKLNFEQLTNHTRLYINVLLPSTQDTTGMARSVCIDIGVWKIRSDFVYGAWQEMDSPRWRAFDWGKKQPSIIKPCPSNQLCNYVSNDMNSKYLQNVPNMDF
ncbi:MAG: hypothetical protein ACPG2Y_00100 [Acholeplasmataceae bacterium]